MENIQNGSEASGVSESLDARLARLEKMLDETHRSVEKIRRYLFWRFVITLVVVVIPLLFIPFAVSSFLKSYSSLNSIVGF